MLKVHFAGRHEKLDIVRTTTVRDWNKSFTHIAVAPKRLAVRVWCPFWPVLNHSLLCASVSVDSRPYSYLLTSATVRIPSPKCGTEPIRYVKLHVRDQRRLTSSRYRNRAEITVLMCERKPYLGPGGGGGTSGISGWECAAGILEPLTYTRASSAEFCYPMLE